MLIPFIFCSAFDWVEVLMHSMIILCVCMYLSLDLLDVLERTASRRTHTAVRPQQNVGPAVLPPITLHDHKLLRQSPRPRSLDAVSRVRRACLPLLTRAPSPPHPTHRQTGRPSPSRFFSPPPQRHYYTPNTHEARYRLSEQKRNRSRGDACMAP